MGDFTLLFDEPKVGSIVEAVDGDVLVLHDEAMAYELQEISAGVLVLAPLSGPTSLLAPLAGDQLVIAVTDDLEAITDTGEPAQLVISTIGPKGDKGEKGDTGDTGFNGAVIEVTTPAATWTLPVPPELGRTPLVAVYIDGHHVVADVVADASWVVVTMPEPMTGAVVLN